MKKTMAKESNILKAPTVKTLESQMNDLARDKGRDVTNVMVDFLDYIIGFFNPSQTPIQGWSEKYEQADNERFFTMMRTYFEVMDHELKRNAWYDAFGDLFQSIHVKGNNNAQFFTPPCLCDLMAETSIEKYHGEEPTARTTFGKRIVISDPSCGSGRNLLAAKAIFDRKQWREPYLVCEDIDLTCCKMSAINMAMHGCFGEAICHDTLCEPDKVRFGYIVNEAMWPIPAGMPSIRPCSDAGRFFGTRICRERKQKTAESKTSGKDQPKQLSLF